MAKHLIVLTVLTMVTISYSEGGQGRKALLIDTTGEQVEVLVTGATDFYKNKYVRPAVENSLYLVTPTLEYCIPVKGIISIQRSDRVLKSIRSRGAAAPLYTVEYVLTGRRIKMEGCFTTFDSSSKNSLKAKFAMSDSEIDPTVIRKLSFLDEPQPTPALNEKPEDSSFALTLVDDTQIAARRLLFHQQNYSTEGYLIGGEYVQDFYPFLPIVRGAIKANVQFKDVLSLTLSPVPNKISPDWYYSFDCGISLVDTSMLKGRLDGVYEFSGFTGVTENGPFFTEVRKVKAIQAAAARKD